MRVTETASLVDLLALKEREISELKRMFAKLAAMNLVMVIVFLVSVAMFWACEVAQ